MWVVKVVFLCEGAICVRECLYAISGPGLCVYVKVQAAGEAHARHAATLPSIAEEEARLSSTKGVVKAPIPTLAGTPTPHGRVPPCPGGRVGRASARLRQLFPQQAGSTSPAYARRGVASGGMSCASPTLAARTWMSRRGGGRVGKVSPHM